MNPIRWLMISYAPHPDEREFLEQVMTQERDGYTVRIAVLNVRSSRSFFGVPMGRRGIQPVWVEVTNRTGHACRLQFMALDPNYFSPLEAAAANHFSGGRRLLQYGLLAWLLFLPLILLLPFKLISVRIANRRMDEFFHDQAFSMRPIPADGQQTGFLFTNLSLGSKVVLVRLMSPKGLHDFEFTVPVPGLDADYLRREFETLYANDDLRDFDWRGLKDFLLQAPGTTTNRTGNRHGDPVNLVVVGDFTILQGAFGARWDETESISILSCWKTAKAFLIGAEYRYSPVSSLHLFGRSQDFALQRIRKSINERIHLRMWATPIRFRGQPVWIGQVSRDIGVRLTWRTWNLTTHRIDPDVDEARDYVVEDLMRMERLELSGYAPGVPICDRTSPRRNLTGDPYYTDGNRAIVVLSSTRTSPKFMAIE